MTHELSKHNPALTVTSDGNIKLLDSPIHEPGPDDVLLHVNATGICGSDIHLWRHGRIGDIVVEGEYTLGHEGAGTVIRLGTNVKSLAVGDRVAIEPGVPCGVCYLCVEGRYNLCERVAFSGVYPFAGTAQRYKVHPAKFVHRLPPSVSFACAALLEPLSVAIHALRTSPVQLGLPAAIFGAGPIGLLTLAVARASGAHPTVITDIEPIRLAFAKKFEPHCTTYQVLKEDSPEETGRKIQRLFAKSDVAIDDPQGGSEMPPVVLECTGMEASIAAAAYTARRGGAINVVGVSPKPLIDNVPFMHLSMAEISLRFINRYHGTWPAALRALDGHLIDPAKLESLVTHRFKLEDAVQAMELVGGTRKAGETVIKVQILDGEEADRLV